MSTTRDAIFLTSTRLCGYFWLGFFSELLLEADDKVSDQSLVIIHPIKKKAFAITLIIYVESENFWRLFFERGFLSLVLFANAILSFCIEQSLMFDFSKEKLVV